MRQKNESLQVCEWGMMGRKELEAIKRDVEKGFILVFRKRGIDPWQGQRQQLRFGRQCAAKG